MTHTECLTLIDKAKSGCSDSFVALSNQYQDLYYKVCHKYRVPLENQGFSFDEVLEEKDSVLFKCISSYNETKGSKFSTWLSNQARYFCLNKIGRKNHKLTLDSEFDMENIPLPDEEDYVDNDRLELITNLIDSLKDSRAKRVFQLRYANGRKNLCWDKIANIMKISRITANKIHKDSLKLLREELAKKSLFDNSENFSLHNPKTQLA